MRMLRVLPVISAAVVNRLLILAGLSANASEFPRERLQPESAEFYHRYGVQLIDAAYEAHEGRAKSR